MAEVVYKWKPIEAPESPADLAVPQLRGFEALWRRQRERLADRKALEAFTERMNRWWSIETGIIERLYDVSEGITLQLVQHGFEASLVPHGEASLPADELVAILRDHRQGLDLVMDVVAGTRELTTGWIKELHALLTRHQPTTRALDSLGRWLDVPLRRGAWKLEPNNPQLGDGSGIHEYCPPEHVASEMDRLVAIHESLPPHPEVRSAWLHHAFTQIHPFQDGNGRVARALASIDFIRAGLFPVLVRRNERDAYIDALRAGDAGDLGPLVRSFARIQEHLLARAISEAQGPLDARDDMATVLAAAAQKRAVRAGEGAAERAAMGHRLDHLAGDAMKLLDATGVEVSRKVQGVEATTRRSAPETTHFFRAQIIEMGDRHGYWVDLNERRSWSRLQLRDGGVTDIVVVLHLIGSPSPGAAVAILFVEHRDRGEPVGSQVSLTAAAEPLLLGSDEEAQAQRLRFVAWLEDAIVRALAQWTRFL